MDYVKLLSRKGTGITLAFLDMRKIEMVRNFPITFGH